MRRSILDTAAYVSGLGGILSILALTMIIPLGLLEVFSVDTVTTVLSVGIGIALFFAVSLIILTILVPTS